MIKMRAALFGKGCFGPLQRRLASSQTASPASLLLKHSEAQVFQADEMSSIANKGFTHITPVLLLPLSVETAKLNMFQAINNAMEIALASDSKAGMQRQPSV